jgi:hypothetical protein
MLLWFANRGASVVLMEVRAGAHEWACLLRKFEPDIRLITVRTVHPFVQRNTIDVADTQGIWTAGRQPEMKCAQSKPRLNRPCFRLTARAVHEDMNHTAQRNEYS